jgi:hypothetical protein
MHTDHQDPPAPQVTVAGQPVAIQEFSAFKAVLAMEIITEVEGTFRKVLAAGGQFRQQYAAENFMTFPRSEARRNFPPEPLVERVDTEEGSVMRPVRHQDTGEVIMGPDPLGHITEADWEASGHQLRVPEYPSERMVTAAMIPLGFREAKTHVFRLIALVLTANTQLETWDEAGTQIATDAGELDKAARKLQHQCMADEPISLFVAAMQIARTQLAGPFEQATISLRTMFQADQDQTSTDPQAPPQEPMQMVSDEGQVEPSPQQSGEKESLPTSSIDSPAATAGTPASSSTESAGVA